MSQIMTKVGPISSEILDKAVFELIRELQPVSYEELQRNLQNVLNVSWQTEVRESIVRLLKDGEVRHGVGMKLEIV